jgi:hypothetical protein
MGVKPLLIGLGLAACAWAPADAQTTTFQGVAECTRHAMAQFRRHDPGFRRFVIDRPSVVGDKFADQVGNQFVSTVYSGKATYEAANGPKKVHFVCLHAGIGKGPVFVYTVAD